MADKVIVLVLEVDLQRPCCYKKVKKILCKFPQIRDQIYNEKANTVTITVVCCDPEKIRDKLCCKGAKVIKSIEIIEASEPVQPVGVLKKPKKVTFAPGTFGSEKPKEKPPPPPAAKPPEKPKETPKPAPPPAALTPPPPEPVILAFPVRTCYEGYGGGGLSYHGYGVPPPPQPCYDGYYGYGYDRPCLVSRCDHYFSEANPQACSIM